jgi:hypothetical protein
MTINENSISDELVALTNQKEDAHYQLNAIIGKLTKHTIGLESRLAGLEGIAETLASLARSQQAEIEQLTTRLDIYRGKQAVPMPADDDLAVSRQAYADRVRNTVKTRKQVEAQ